MAAQIYVNRNGDCLSRVSTYISIGHKRKAKQTGLSLSWFMRTALSIYFELYPTGQPSGDLADALAPVVERLEALRSKEIAQEDEAAARLVAEHEARRRDEEERRRLDAAIRLEAIIRQAEQELATLRGFPA